MDFFPYIGQRVKGLNVDVDNSCQTMGNPLELILFSFSFFFLLWLVSYPILVIWLNNLKIIVKIIDCEDWEKISTNNWHRLLETLRKVVMIRRLKIKGEFIYNYSSNLSSIILKYFLNDLSIMLYLFRKIYFFILEDKTLEIIKLT